MILVLGRDADAHVKWLREKLLRPIMTAERVEGIRNLLPAASAVFIRASTYGWKSHLDLPDHSNVFMVGTRDETGLAQHLMRNFREASIKDVYLVGEPEDEQRLILRFEEQVIEEVADDDEKSVRSSSGGSNGGLDGHRVEAIPAEPF